MLFVWWWCSVHLGFCSPLQLKSGENGHASILPSGYRLIELKNGIEALLVSNLDQKKQKAACSCCVQARLRKASYPHNPLHLHPDWSSVDWRWDPLAIPRFVKVSHTTVTWRFSAVKWDHDGSWMKVLNHWSYIAPACTQCNVVLPTFGEVAISTWHGARWAHDLFGQQEVSWGSPIWRVLVREWWRIQCLHRMRIYLHLSCYLLVVSCI